MIYAAPGASFEARIDGCPSGLAGTIGVQILDNAGGVALARVTEGIVEDPAGSGSYIVTLTAPSVAGGYSVFWDTGTVTPTTTASEDLTVTSTIVTPVAVQRFAEPSDLAARLGIVMTADATDRASTLLTTATGLIQDAADQTILLVTDDEFSMPGTTDDRILLPQRPVVSVKSVTLDGVALAEDTDWWLDGNAIARMSGSRVQLLAGLEPCEFVGGFGWPSQTLEVVYTHGYATPPLTLKAICMDAVVRVWVNPDSVVQENVAGVQTTYAPFAEPPRGLQLTDAEEKKISRMFGRRAVSVSLGGI